MSNDAFVDSGIAIIGMACKVPGANNLSQFWANILGGTESLIYTNSIGNFNRRIQKAKNISRLENYVNISRTMSNIEMFDHEFFGFTPREAQVLDPQHRIFLECCYEAFEDSGYVPKQYDGSVGVFASTAMSTYLIDNLLGNNDLFDTLGDTSILHGNEKDYLAPLISYKLNLTGPSVNINTGCSSSTVAIAQACNSLLGYESDLAVAGGVRINVRDVHGYVTHQDGLLSTDGRCHPFDADASGTVFGNGAGAVVLKRYGDAVENGDTIYAVIRATSVNNDGAEKLSFSAPSVRGQVSAIREAIEYASIDPTSIGYVEAHGTATRVGDQIEVSALSEAFGTDKRQFCALGSVKANIGNLGVASGVVSLIKATLSVKNAVLPPSINFNRCNPDIEFEATPFFVNTEKRQWDNSSSPRRASINSFGVGGTNAHIIIEQVEQNTPLIEGSGPNVLLFSARTEECLKQKEIDLANYLAENPDVSMNSVAFTLCNGREHFKHRSSVVCHDIDTALNVLGNNVYCFANKSKIKKCLFLSKIDAREISALKKKLKKFHRFESYLNESNEVLSSRNVTSGTIRAHEIGSASKTVHDALSVLAIKYSFARFLTDLSGDFELIYCEDYGTHLSDAIFSSRTFADVVETVLDSEAIIPDSDSSPLDNDDSVIMDACLTLGNVLSRSVRGKFQGYTQNKMVYVHLNCDDIDTDTIQMLARLWRMGVDIDWSVLNDNQNYRRIPLPTYPFNRSKHWVNRRNTISSNVENTNNELELKARPNLEAEYTSPETLVEKYLVAICEDLLGVRPIGIYDNFFELGGHSLLLTKLQAKIFDKWEIHIGVKDFYQTPTIFAFSKIVERVNLRSKAESLSENGDEFFEVEI